MPVPPLRSFRYWSRDRWLSRCRAAVAVPELFAETFRRPRDQQTLLSVSCCRMPLLLLSCLLPDRFSLFSAFFPLLSYGLILFSTIPPFWNRTVAFFSLGTEA